MANVQKKALRVAVNDRGQRIGESHGRAVLSDHEVWLMLELRAEGYSYGWLAAKFEVGKTTTAKICRGEIRAQVASEWRTLAPRKRR